MHCECTAVSRKHLFRFGIMVFSTPLFCADDFVVRAAQQWLHGLATQGQLRAYIGELAPSIWQGPP